MSEVQPLLWAASDVVRLSGHLHHRHSLPLTDVAVEVAALTRRPRPCKRTRGNLSPLLQLQADPSQCCDSLPDEEDMVAQDLASPLGNPSAQFSKSTSVLSVHLQRNMTAIQ